MSDPVELIEKTSSKTLLSGPFYGIGAAVLFGLSTPLARMLLTREIDPLRLAGLLYLGSGVGLTLLFLLKRLAGRRFSKEAGVSWRDAPWLGGAILLGGILGPVLMMNGLKDTHAATASLLTNMEAVFTATLAWIAFREQFDRRVFLGMLAIVTGSVVLSLQPGVGFEFSWSALLILGACLSWGLDNNLTRQISGGDPMQVAGLKGLIAGSATTLLANTLDIPWPAPELCLNAGIVGFLGYGISLMLFVLALRNLGTARSSAYFSLAPFVGAAVAILFLGDALSPNFLMAALLMAVGVFLQLSEHHAHEHAHEPMAHAHLHTHDEHHQHAHGPDDPPGEPHSHWHQHEHLVHTHPHYPDLHHRHSH